MCYVKRQNAVEETKIEEGVEECMVGGPACCWVIRGKSIFEWRLKQLREKATWLGEKRILERENKCRCSWGWKLPGVPPKQQGGQYDWAKLARRVERETVRVEMGSDCDEDLRTGEVLGWLMSKKKSLQKVFKEKEHDLIKWCWISYFAEALTLPTDWPAWVARNKKDLRFDWASWPSVTRYLLF